MAEMDLWGSVEVIG